MKESCETHTIGDIGNYYGNLQTKKENNKYYFGIENYDGTYWQEIPLSLYDELIKFAKSNPNKFDILHELIKKKLTIVKLED